MAKMRDMDVRAYAVKEAIARVINANAEGLEPAGQNTVAVPIMVDIDGTGELTEVWVTAELTVKQWKPYNARGVVRPAYEPFTAEQEWQDTLRMREKRAAEVAEKKAKKAAKAAKVDKA